MVKHAAVIVPDPTPSSPSYLSASVAGLPLLHRHIYGLWRAGAARVTIVASPATAPLIAKTLALLEPRGMVAIASGWGEVWEEPADQEEYPRLVLWSDVLVLPRVLSAFADLDLGSNELAVALIKPEAAPRPPEGPVRPVYEVSLEGRQVKSLCFTLTPAKPVAAGLVLLSPEAWQEFARLERLQAALPGNDLVSPDTVLLSYVKHKVQDGKVAGVAYPAPLITPIRHEGDLKLAAERLIRVTEGSPWGEGYLESNVNRRLARMILPYLLNSRLPPNAVTGLDLLVGLGASVLFMRGAYLANVAAAFLLLVVMVLDTLDGLLARLTFRESRLGVRLDLYGDTVLNLVVFTAIALGQYRGAGAPFLLTLLGLLALGYLGCWVVLNPLSGTRADRAKPPPSVALEVPDLGLKGKLMSEATSRDFFYLILFSALLDVLDWLIILIAVGANLFAALLFLYRRRGHI